MYIGACWARLRPGWIVGGPSGEEEEAPGPPDTHLAESSRADRFGRLAEAGPKSEVSEGPKETFSSAGEDFAASMSNRKIIQKTICFSLILTLRRSSWRALEAILERFGRY